MNIKPLYDIDNIPMCHNPNFNPELNEVVELTEESLSKHCPKVLYTRRTARPLHYTGMSRYGLNCGVVMVNYTNPLPTEDYPANSPWTLTLEDASKTLYFIILK